MSEFNPVRGLDDLATLDETELMEGYLSGLFGESEPGSNKSRSFWHGWRNGTSDRTGVTDEAQQALARNYLGH